MRLSSAFCAPLGALAVLATLPSASADVVVTPVTASVLFAGTGGSASFSAGINRQSGIGDTGTLLGQLGENVSIRGRWTAQLVGGAGAGTNGGNVYAITVQIGSIIKIGPFAQTYTQPVVQSSDLIGGSSITTATVGFGVGGGGLRFNDFDGQNQILIDNSGFFGDAAYSMRVDPGYAPFGVTGDPSQMASIATIAGDGSVGFSTTFNAALLYASGSDVSSDFAGNLAANQIRGFNSSFFVEVVAVPAPGAIALLGLAGLAGRRRR